MRLRLVQAGVPPVARLGGRQQSYWRLLRRGLTARHGVGTLPPGVALAQGERLPGLGQSSAEGVAVGVGLTCSWLLGGQVGEGDVVRALVCFVFERLIRDWAVAVVEEDRIFFRIAERRFVLTGREDERGGDGGGGSEGVIMVKIIQASKIISVVPFLLHWREL